MIEICRTTCSVSSRQHQVCFLPPGGLFRESRSQEYNFTSGCEKEAAWKIQHTSHQTRRQINQWLKAAQVTVWEEELSIYHQLYGSGGLLKMSDRRRTEGCRTPESVRRKRRIILAEWWKTSTCVLPSRSHVCPSAAGSYSSLSANEERRRQR